MPPIAKHLGNTPYTGPKLPVSLVILTINEQVNIEECLKSCAWSDDIHVLDSGSSDRTVEIAERLGVQVHYHPFTSFGDQRNWAIDYIPCKHDWHFHVDADERFTEKLVEEIRRRVLEPKTPEGCSAYLVPSKMMFLGRWLKRSGGYPAYQMRLFKKGECRFVDFGHGQREDCDGKVGTLEQPYIHYAFSKGLVEWFGKHNDYSSREANEGEAVRSQHRSNWKLIFSRDGMTRRRAIKELSYMLRGRMFFRFLYLYLFRLGVFDGVAGFHYCWMISTYEYWIELKMVEQRTDWFERIDKLAEARLNSGTAEVTSGATSGGTSGVTSGGGDGGEG